MTFNPFSELKTKELTKTFRQQYQELIKEDQVDEDDEDFNSALQFINQMNNHANYLDEMERYVQRQLNRYARRHCCGRKVRYFKTDGTLGSITWHCTDYRLCPNCRRLRREELTDALGYHHGNLPYGEFLKVKEIHQGEYDMYSKRAQREKLKYGKINQPDHRILFFSNGNNDSWGEELKDYNDYEDEYNQIKWLEIIEQIPDGKRISGSIWQKPGKGNAEDKEGEGEEEETEKKLVAITKVATSATEEEEDLAALKAIASTQIQVSSIEELQKALFNRTRLWIDEVGKDKCQPFIDYTWFSENDIETWNKSIVSSNYMENNGIDKTDKKTIRTPIKELTPVQQLALVK